MIQARARGSRFLAAIIAVGLLYASVSRGTWAQTVLPTTNPLNAAWTSVGPAQVASQRYGLVTGRVTAVTIDPADSSGNTVFIGTTGGGVWKSVNAAGPAAAVSFTPLTDSLPVFSPGGVALPSLTIGALSVSGGVILAGTGDPNDALDSYYGEGILRSTDGGVTWTLAQQSNDGAAGHHSFVGLASAGFAWSTATPGLVVAAMSQSAEGVLVNAPDATYSVMGLYYSTDAGVTWKMATIEDGSQIVQRPGSGGAPGNAATSVVWNATRHRFYAAVRFHGYYESSDGVTWTRLAAQPGAGMSLTACPTNPSSAGSAACPLWRGALAVQPATGDTFALTVDVNNVDQGVWQDLCNLTSGSCTTQQISFSKRLASAALEVSGGTSVIAQGDYNLALAAVSSGTDTLLFAGAQDLYRCSLAAGCIWRNTTNTANGCAAPAMVSPAMHTIAAEAGLGTSGMPLIFVGNDGGLWRSQDGVNQQQTPCSSDDAKHFDNLNSALGSLADVVSLAQHPSDRTTLLVGLGANGSAAPSGTGEWSQLAAGEGGAVAIDQANPQNSYVTSGAGVNVHFCGKGSACTASDFAGASTIGTAQVGGDASLIDVPMLLDPALSSSVLLGTCRVWRGPAQSGAGWPGSNQISSVLGAGFSTVCSATNGMIRSLAAGGPASGSVAVQNAGSTVLYAGMAGTRDGGGNYGGHVFANYTAGTAGANTLWTDVAKSSVTNDVADGGVFNPGGFDVSSLVADTHDPTGKTLYATVMGFAGNGTNAPHVYRSTNGGASWTNISANLPNMPANSLAVDPNDANTLYVAMDSGVYATTQVSTCPSTNCWSVYGVGLPNSPVTSLAAAASMETGDGRTGELRAATYGRGVWEIPLLGAAYPTAPAMTVSPVSLTFAPQAVATASAAQSISVTNSGNAALTISQIATSGDYTETNNCTGSIAIGANCTLQVSFLPTSTGARTGMITIYGNVAGGQATVALAGTGVAAASIILDPASVTYAATNVGSASPVQNITISNTGGVTATLQTPSVTGDFTITANTCGTSLAPNEGCTVSVKFVPTASGTRTGTFAVTDSVGTQTASLTGAGQLPSTDTLTPLVLTFAAQQLNTASAGQSVTLTNTGDAALTGVSAAIASGDFTVVNGCGNSLAGHSTCALTVAFVPKNIGAGTGSMTVTDSYRSQTVALSGTGVAPAGVSLSPVSGMTFTATGVGLGSATQTMTLTNNGGIALSIQSITATGDFAIAAGSNSCGASLPAGSACTLQVLFTPTAPGLRAGTLVVTDSAITSPQNLALTGMGVDFALNPNGSTTQTIAAGAQAVYPLLLTSAAGVPGAVSFACTGAPANSTCVVTPSTPALGGTTTIAVTVATNVAALHEPWQRQMVWFAMALPLGLFASRRGRRRSATALLCGLVLLSGCMAARVIPQTSGVGGGTTSPTPSGTYNLTVSAASTGLTRTVGLTLVVK